jgi:alkanesulfonate monooxygenase SsuD/methylene tetrahydromethanopterin reductase-like flavin-dependent oxidoreductase (luciferase family)
LVEHVLSERSTSVEIGIGIPNSIRGTTGAQLLEWARRAEAAGFSSLGSIGAVAYPTYEELTVFAAAGAVTERIRFVSDVLIAPARSAAELAKQAATVQEITGGRLTLGLGVGWRDGDYRLTGRDFTRRGQLFDEQLAGLRQAWSGAPLLEGTKPVAPEGAHAGVPILVGGETDAAIRRVVEHGIGWTAGGLPPEMTAPFAERVRAAWQEAGRAGSPRIVALNYFSLGDTEAQSRAYLLDYYEAMGSEMAEMIAGSAHRSPQAIKDVVAGFAEIGIDELILDPTLSDPGQVDLLAEVVL